MPERSDKIMKKLLLLLLTIVLMWPSGAFANGNDNCPMDGWRYMMSFWHGGMFMWILFLVIIVVAIYLILQSTKSSESGSSFKEVPRGTAIDILKKRYAEGEIIKEEFERMKKDLEG